MMSLTKRTLQNFSKNVPASKFSFAFKVNRRFSSETQKTEKIKQESKQADPNEWIELPEDNFTYYSYRIFRYGMLAIGIGGLGYTTYCYREGQKTFTWVPTEAKILLSDIRLAAPETPAVHDLVYEYFVDGKQYFGYKFNFSNPNLWISGETLGFRFDYTPLIQGSKVIAFYDPKNPSRVTIQQGVDVNGLGFLYLISGGLTIAFSAIIFLL